MSLYFSGFWHVYQLQNYTYLQADWLQLYNLLFPVNEILLHKQTKTAQCLGSFPHLDLIIKNGEVLGCKLWVACNQFVRETFPDTECSVHTVNDQAVSNVKSNLKTPLTRLPSHAAKPRARSEFLSDGSRSHRDQLQVKRQFDWNGSLMDLWQMSLSQY